ncbi:MAG: hypothetical protein KJP09_01645 [Bacteroidia bacterium]|nr:hypothetical protein [Bacteroidia bacterium]NNK28552.1 hypothetical protein [Flavobacteriaceae bacterium]
MASTTSSTMYDCELSFKLPWRAPSASSSATGSTTQAHTNDWLDFNHSFDYFLGSLLQEESDDVESISSWSTLLCDLRKNHGDPSIQKMVVYNQFFDIGTRVEKIFPNPEDYNVLQMYDGVIEAFDAEFGYYSVRFEDNDEAEFTYEEIVAMLRDI